MSGFQIDIVYGYELTSTHLKLLTQAFSHFEASVEPKGFKPQKTENQKT